MPYSKPPEVQHTVRYCALLQREVRVVLMRQSDGSWQFIRCLDQEKACHCSGQQCPVRAGERQRPYGFSWV